MPSFTTIFRAVVMVAVGAIGVKGWHLYGPTNEQVKSVVAQAIDVAKSAMQSQQAPNSGAAPDPRGAAPQFGATKQVAPPAAALGQSDAPKLLPNAVAVPGTPSSPGLITPPVESPARSLTASGDRMPELMSRLQQLGAADTNLAPWGNGGHLFRFSCRAPLASTPAMTQHFESVAAEPAMAVEQVLAKVEAWRVAQNAGAERLKQIRY